MLFPAAEEEAKPGEIKKLIFRFPGCPLTSTKNKGPGATGMPFLQAAFRSPTVPMALICCGESGVPGVLHRGLPLPIPLVYVLAYTGAARSASPSPLKFIPCHTSPLIPYYTGPLRGAGNRLNGPEAPTANLPPQPRNLVTTTISNSNSFHAEITNIQLSTNSSRAQRLTIHSITTKMLLLAVDSQAGAQASY